MQKLRTEFNKSVFNYKQLERTDKKAIYQQIDEYGNIVGHEIFFIKIVKESEAFGKVFEEREKYPSDNDFGQFAWSVGRDIAVAMEKYNNLHNRLVD